MRWQSDNCERSEQLLAKGWKSCTNKAKLFKLFGVTLPSPSFHEEGPHAGMHEPTLARLFERVAPLPPPFTKTGPHAGMQEPTLAPLFERVALAPSSFRIQWLQTRPYRVEAVCTFFIFHRSLLTISSIWHTLKQLILHAM
jgi:hypothetical protein